MWVELQDRYEWCALVAHPTLANQGEDDGTTDHNAKAQHRVSSPSPQAVAKSKFAFPLSSTAPAAISLGGVETNNATSILFSQFKRTCLDDSFFFGKRLGDLLALHD
jgi:hypothetical protein